MAFNATIRKNLFKQKTKWGGEETEVRSQVRGCSGVLTRDSVVFPHSLKLPTEGVRAKSVSPAPAGESRGQTLWGRLNRRKARVGTGTPCSLAGLPLPSLDF